MKVAPPESVAVKIGSRTALVRWTNRAAYRLDASPTPAPLEDARGFRGFAFLCVHVWAMLVDEADRRRWPTPEALAEAINLEDVAAVKELWRVVMRQAYNVDVDQPAEDTPAEGAAEATPAPQQPEGGEPPPSTGPSS